MVTAAFNDGFSSKSSKNNALKCLNSAYDIVRESITEIILSKPRTEDRAMTPELLDIYWDVLPESLHHWNSKRAEKVLVVLPEVSDQVQMINELRGFRETIKAVEVVPPVKTNSEEVRITKSIRELMEQRKTQYERGLELSDLFGGLAVHANVHYVTNQHGTTFLRAFYYMHGNLTPLNVIIAVAQERTKNNKESK